MKFSQLYTELEDSRISKRSLGALGERLAAEYFENRGYELVGQNFSCRYGEIDLILKRGELFTFVEVKLRNSKQFGKAADSITGLKIQKIQNAIWVWLAKNGLFEDSVGGIYLFLLDWSSKEHKYVEKVVRVAI